ncbi:MAG: ABC transporter ATP-binding protein [Opitutaceae bacterium]|jgi:iron complex transport system ATP-binding protein|nr:ABC transporter ATP-binding protein [Opitutaceae bacterium]
MTPALTISRATIPGRIDGVSLALAPGVMAGLVGPNGSGKSTLLQVAAGILPAPAGAVLWNGQPLARIPMLERGRRAAWVPQDARFEFGFTVRSVVAQGRYAHGDDNRGVDEALARFDLVSLAHRPVNRISGGERQRVLLARAHVTAAPLLLWDEPLAALDPRHALEILLLGNKHTRAGGTLLFSLHDLRMAYILDTVVVMHEGRLRAIGKPAEVLTPALLLEVFGVRTEITPSLSLALP